ncbi:MAG: hypothetical protein LBD93_04600, partial [Treponema sp.]|nr:hypothetical protein [Treponema sp.]
MRKTLLRSSLLGFVAAVLLLAGCESPTSFDVSYGNIGSVQNLKVTPYTGVNLLTWDPVADADTYNIYRKEKPADKDWGEFVELKSNISAINYPDIIKDDNILTDSSEYTYRVIAKSRNEVLSSSSTEVSYKTDTAKFPAATPQFPSKGTALSVTITDATIQADNTYGIATLTWTASIDNPAIEYKVTSSNNNQWGIQEGTTVATQSINNTGFADAQILASFTTGYYPASAAVYVDPVAYNVQHLDSITDVSITSATRTGNTNQAIITYTKVTGATAYVLQKALSNNNVAGVLTWEDVGTTGAVDLGTSYQVTDTVTPERWQYRLFVRTANGISQPSYFMVSKVTESVTGYASASRQLKTADSTTDDLDNAIYEIDFSISDVTEGATYRLQYRKIGTSNQDNANDVAEVGEWTLGPSVTPTGADLSNKKFHIYFTPPAQRQGY